MAQSYDSPPQDEAQPLLPVPSGHPPPYRRRIHLRRKRLPTASLGGRRAARAAAFWRSVREIRWKWVMSVRCTCLAKKLNQLLLSKDIAGAGDGNGDGFNDFLKKVLMEISLAVPLPGALSLSN